MASTYVRRDIRPPQKSSFSKRRVLAGLILGLLAGLAIRFLLHTYIFFPYQTGSSDMAPTISPGQSLYVWRLFPKEELKRGAIVLLTHPTLPHYLLVRRIIGLPGEKVELYRRRIFINQQELMEKWEQQIQKAHHYPQAPLSGEASRRDFSPPVNLKQDEIYVLGDDRKAALDSRILGPFHLKNVVGLVAFKGLLSSWPFSSETPLVGQPRETIPIRWAHQTGKTVSACQAQQTSMFERLAR